MRLLEVMVAAGMAVDDEGGKSTRACREVKRKKMTVCRFNSTWEGQGFKNQMSVGNCPTWVFLGCLLDVVVRTLTNEREATSKSKEPERVSMAAQGCDVNRVCPTQFIRGRCNPIAARLDDQVPRHTLPQAKPQ
jgi:hypothetical protein